jgi:hypothetical protein
VKSVEGKDIIFANGDTIKTTLNGLRYYDSINSEGFPTYLLLSGVDCDSCDAGESLYIHSPRDGDLIVRDGKNSYSLPGVTYDFLGKTLVYQARIFYGEVLKDTIGVIWFQKHLLDNGQYSSSVYLLKIQSDSTFGSFLVDSIHGHLPITLGLLKQNKCKELEGSYNQYGP